MPGCSKKNCAKPLACLSAKRWKSYGNGAMRVSASGTVISFSVVLQRVRGFKKMKFSRLRHFPFESLVWLSALLVLFWFEPVNNHVVLCPVQLLGFDFCPGCGLGRAVALALNGHFNQSLATHPLGIFAIIVLLYRSIQLLIHYCHGENFRNTPIKSAWVFCFSLRWGCATSVLLLI